MHNHRSNLQRDPRRPEPSNVPFQGYGAATAPVEQGSLWEFCITNGMTFTWIRVAVPTLLVGASAAIIYFSMQAMAARSEAAGLAAIATVTPGEMFAKAPPEPLIGEGWAGELDLFFVRF